MATVKVLPATIHTYIDRIDLLPRKGFSIRKENHKELLKGTMKDIARWYTYINTAYKKTIFPFLLILSPPFAIVTKIKILIRFYCELQIYYTQNQREGTFLLLLILMLFCSFFYHIIIIMRTAMGKIKMFISDDSLSQRKRWLLLLLHLKMLWNFMKRCKSKEENK